MAMSFSYDSKDEVIAAAIQFMEARAKYKGKAFTSPIEAKTLFRLRIGDRTSEVFCVVFLDTRHRLIKVEEMFRGTIDGAMVYPREIVKLVLLYNAAAVLLAHNHPSGIVAPSEADKTITRRISDALNLVDVRTLDHLIVAQDDAFSFAENGLI